MKKILVIDQCAENRAQIKKFAYQWDSEIVAIDFVDQAVEAMCAENPPQIILVDWNSEELQTLDLVRQIRELKTGSATYIIVMGDSNQSGQLEDAFAAGADDFLIKPFDKNELRARVLEAERVLSRHESVEEAINRIAPSTADGQ